MSADAIEPQNPDLAYDLMRAPDLAYDLMRADEERARALSTDNVPARAAHQQLALAYRQRAWRRDPRSLA